MCFNTVVVICICDSQIYSRPRFKHQPPCLNVMLHLRVRNTTPRIPGEAALIGKRKLVCRTEHQYETHSKQHFAFASLSSSSPLCFEPWPEVGVSENAPRPGRREHLPSTRSGLLPAILLKSSRPRSGRVYEYESTGRATGGGRGESL